MLKKKECSMRKETLGAALFFCGFGIFISFCDPLDNSWIIRLIVGVILMLLGLKIGGNC
jgi:hypothetical protein